MIATISDPSGTGRADTRSMSAVISRIWVTEKQSDARYIFLCIKPDILQEVIARQSGKEPEQDEQMNGPGPMAERAGYAGQEVE